MLPYENWKVCVSIDKEAKRRIFYCYPNDGAVARNIDEKSLSPSHYLKPTLPSTALFIDNVYICGKFSLLENLPYPSLQVLDNHAYLSIIDCISHLLLLLFSDNFNFFEK
jgi:hypothetical protein